MRSDDEIQADMVARYQVRDFTAWQNIVDHLASDVPGLLDRAVAAERRLAAVREVRDDWASHRANEPSHKLWSALGRAPSSEGGA